MFGSDLFNVSSTISDVTENAESIAPSLTWGDAIFVALLFVIAYVAGIIVSYSLKRRFSHRMAKDQLDLVIKIVRILIVVAALAFALPGVFHISLTIIGLVLVAFIIVIAMSGSKVISNAAAGIGLHYERTFSSGDFVKVNDTTGTVESVKLFSTLIRTPRGTLIRIPNDVLYTTSITNYYAYVARRYEYPMSIGYKDNPARAAEIIREIVDQHPFVLRSPAPEVFVSEIAADSVVIKFRFWLPALWANTQDDLSIATEFLPRIKAALEAEGFDLPYAQRVIWFANQPPGPDKSP